jgi:hypothetical protein
MPFSFPSSPTVGQTSTQNGRSYTYAGGSVWELTPASGGGSDARWDLFLPPAPTSVTATAGNAQVVVAWTAPTGVLSQTPIVDYTVQYQPSGGSWTTFTRSVSTATSATVTGLQNGTDYTFRVAAVNGVGTGAYSAASSAATPSSGVSVAYLVVAGGGSGGKTYGGGGGAGGMLTGTATLDVGSTNVVTVGAGASGVTGNWVPGSQGSNSSLGSSLTAVGGGYGGGNAANGGPNAGGNGGSGGGVGGGYPKQSPGTGTAGQGNAGGTCTDAPGGGGGGAGSVGGNGTNVAAGSGGNGQSWLNGVTYAGGGGGGIHPGSASGGSGGGGAGSYAGDAGATNTGGGGGGASDSASWAAPSGAGGSGVVIIRTTVAASATTGSPTVTQAGGYNWYTFTGTGSITF